MSTASEIVQYWGIDNLLRINMTAIADLRLSENTIDYLTNVGLPRTSEFLEASLGIEFEVVHQNRVVTLSSHFGNDLNDNSISLSIGSWPLLGHCYDKLICINTDDDSIVLLEGDPETGFMDWFANSSVESYVRFVTLALQSFRRGTEGSTITQSILDLKRQFAAIDPEAMKKNTNWWCIVLEDIAGL